jgi:tRNA (pseudouridine54-N1)-methyltransferase
VTGTDRTVVLLAHEVPTDPDAVSLSDLPAAGRLDLVARAVVSALLVSHDVRADTTVRVVVDDAVEIRVDGDAVRGLHPDERSTAAQLRAALETATDIVGRRPVEHGPGVTVRRAGLAGTLDDAGGTVVWLHEDGAPAPAAETTPPTDPTFVVSDHREFTDDEAALLSERADRRVSLGPRAVHADDAVALAHNWVDTADVS